MNQRMNPPVLSVLIDNRNFDSIAVDVIRKIAAANFVGFDIETKDDRRHEGLNRFMNVNDEGHKAGNKALIFDTRRTDVTGFSIYADGDAVAYYINLLHADVENRLPWHKAKMLLDAKRPEAYWLSHNAPYELTMMKTSLGYDLSDKIICTLQLAVTAFNGDTYSVDQFLQPGIGGISKIFKDVQSEFTFYEPGMELTKAQDELLYKVISKTSDSEWSYNGYVKSMAFGFGLKNLTKKFLNYTQTTFEEVMRGRPHMGCLTGEEVCAYGADDAWVCVHLFHKLLQFIQGDNPEVMNTFFTQENPMIHVFSDTWREGVRADKEMILRHREAERNNAAKTLREMKAAVRELLPFNRDCHEKLEKYDSWYAKNHTKYRTAIERWAKTPDSEDAFTQLMQARSPISKAWAEESGVPESAGPNLVHYMTMRTIVYDLCGCSYQQADGKTQSDAEARTKMRERWLKKQAHLIREEKDKETGDNIIVFVEGADQIECVKAHAVVQVLDAYKKLAETDTVIKLFITNYLNLIDPETGRMYPTLSSMLNSRRMAMSNPNLNQLPKTSEKAYIRQVFLADQDDHVIVSADWSSVELVLIGEFSGDPEFKKAFGQLPYQDLHGVAAAGCLDISLEEFNNHPDKKALRRDLGKGSNFGYWYSGGLGTVAGTMGWSSDEMWERVEKYRNTFAVAEAWRLATIEFARNYGYVQLPDFHKRYRYESTGDWINFMRMKFEAYGPVVQRFGDLCIKKIHTRSGNQAVNSMIQGSCATLAKRSILRMNQKIKELGLRARFMFPVHDELVYSVHKEDVMRFIPILREVMCNHPDIVKDLILNCSVAIGKNYRAFDIKENPFGQVELDELNKKFPWLPEDKWETKLSEEDQEVVLAYMFGEKEKLQNAQLQAIS